MTSRVFDFPVFDADNHLYETREALTKFLPDRYQGVIDYVEVRGRTKIVVRGQISDYIPNPTFDVVARPGAQEDYFRHGNPEGKSRREIFGEPMRCHPGLPRARPPPRADGRAGHRPDAHVPHAGQPGRGADARRPRADPRRHPRPQRVDVRDVAVRLRGPHLHHAGHHPAHRGAGHRGARVGGRARAPRSCSSGRRRCPGYRGPRSFGLPEFDPFWEKVVEHDVLVAMHSSDSGYERYANDWMGERQRDAAVPAPGLPHAVRPGGPIEDAVSALVVPRRAVALPAAQGGRHRERQQLGRAAAQDHGRHLQEDAPGLRRGPGRRWSSATSTSARSGRRTSASWPS